MLYQMHIISFVASLFVISAVCVNAMEGKYVGCYYTPGSVATTDIDANLFTHLFYAFLTVNSDGTLNNIREDYIQGLVNLKQDNPELKLLFSLQSQNGSFSRVVADSALREKLVQSSYEVVKQYEFDGIDVDWEYPTEAEKNLYISLLSELSAILKTSDYILTAAVRAIPTAGYIVPEMVKYLDIINIMTYDYYGAWSNHTGQNSPLYPSSLDSNYEKQYLSVEASINNYINAGAPKCKIAQGIPFYGRTFNLTDPNQHGLHAPSNGAGNPTTATYYNVLKNFQNYTTEWNDEQKCPYKYSGSTWLGYDDEKSIHFKVKFAKENDLCGVFVWQLAGDDVHGEFSNQSYPLLHVINEALA